MALTKTRAAIATAVVGVVVTGALLLTIGDDPLAPVPERVRVRAESNTWTPARPAIRPLAAVAPAAVAQPRRRSVRVPSTLTPQPEQQVAKDRIRLRFRFADFDWPPGVSAESHMVRFDLLLAGQVEHTTTRTVTGRLSQQRWSVVIRRDQFEDTPIMARVTLVSRGVVTGAAELTVDGFAGTDAAVGVEP